ncbi:MAG: MgtC/SapB family protein [Vampirovibrionales bacterium]
MILRIVEASVLGAVIGFEREVTHKAAGLRTHMLVCMGACIFMVLSMTNLAELTSMSVDNSHNWHTNINFDPSRIGAQIVTGIGFIGGGVLLKEGGSIRGITTAASLWNVAAIGMLVGVGLHSIAIFATFITIVILYTMGKIPILQDFKRFKHKEVLKLTVYVKESQEQAVMAYVEDQLEERIRSVETCCSVAKEGDSNPTLILTYFIDIHHYVTHWSKWKQGLKRLNGVERINLTFDP